MPHPTRTRRWRCGCGRGRWPRSSARSTCSARARRCGRRSRPATPHSMILYGPPGTGKTTLARLVAVGRRRGLRGGVGRQRRPGRGPGRDRARARSDARAGGRPTVLFLDEIHRFNKAQQDALLPAVEDGLLTLIGATTENPYFEVNSALLSRCQIYELQAARRRADRGAAAPRARRSRARCRRSRRRSTTTPWRCLPSAAAATPARRSARSSGRRPPRGLGRRRSTSPRPRTRSSARRSATTRAATSHYDYISAWIKATRGSDPDASLYYLAAMLEGGEDPRFIARRMVILASEDVGNADPQALLVATAAAAGGRPGRPAGVPDQPRPGRRLPGAGPEVERLVHGARRAPRPHPPPRRRGAAPVPPATATTRGRSSSAAGSATSYPHDEPDGVADQPLTPDGRPGRALLRARPIAASRRELAQRLAQIRASAARQSRESTRSPTL